MYPLAFLINSLLLESYKVHSRHHQSMDAAFSNQWVAQGTRNNIVEAVSQTNRNNPQYVIQEDPALLSWIKNTTQKVLGKKRYCLHSIEHF